MPTVSIVITCFNYERYIALSVGSALAQSIAPTEIIVVNDGSTDGSAGVLASFGAQITVIDQANAGQIAATNRGYAASSGDIVMFLDADDILETGAVQAVIEAWTPDCVKVQFELEVINGAGELLGRRFCNYVEPYGPEQVRSEFKRFGTYVWPVMTGNAFARRFLQGVMPLTVKMAPDGILNTVAPLYGSIQVVPQALARYRLHQANQNYHGTTSNAIGVRFAKQVNLRVSEVNVLRQHAAALGVQLPEGNLLDHDMTFINYRLMALKLGEPYEESAGDSPGRLWRAGIVALRKRPLPSHLKLFHMLWLTALRWSPRSAARALIQLRFQRAELLQPWRRRWATLTGLGRAAETGPGRNS
ncbi:hypothetical protein ASF44_06475 [Pseudorhodoferax sp. Leaf274]|nr:hypothetical protein ASF44_06475 [Pseudorhodoferax sp. Leaf274]